MHRHIRDLWTSALRSGEYTQGTDLLHRVIAGGGAKFCCWGVLSALAVEHGVIPPPEPERTASGLRYFSYDGHGGYPPASVLEWAGVTIRKQSAADDLVISLAVMNDSGASFADIADRIEQEL